MHSVKNLLVLCTIVSAIGLYESATVSFDLDPVRPSLDGDLTFTCEANYNTNKLKKLSIMAGSQEILSYQPDQRPRVQWINDETKQRFDFKKELSKTRTFIQMTLKKPKCHDQNIYKCIYFQNGQDPMEEESRVNFYVDKGDVQMINNRKSECAPINVTCIGQAGNPPEQMKWLKKRKGDSKFEEIERSYITDERMAFHQSNCSNTRVEHFRYNPSAEETDLVIKCGFGDETEHMPFHTPVVMPENFEVSAKPEGQHKVGEEIQLTCTGLGVTDRTQFRWFKKTKGENDMKAVQILGSEDKFENADDMCHTMATQMIAYMPEVNDEIIYCEAIDNGQMSRAEFHIQLGVISNPTDGITTKDDEGKAEPEPEHVDHDDHDDHEEHDMTTSMPTTEEEVKPETDPGTKAEPPAGTKPEPASTKPEPEPETTTMKKAESKPAMGKSGQLQCCLSNVFLISSMLIVAIQFLFEQSS